MANVTLRGQSGYGLNDMTGDFPVHKILNSSSASSTFSQLKDRLLVVDFFGTWCVPCVKALPKLSALQEKYNDRVRILLVSNEPEAKLTSFISRQQDFTLPLVVDEKELFTKHFQPPSYPYTVIVNKSGKVIAIPSQEEMTAENIDKWLKEEEAGSVVIGMTNKVVNQPLSSTNKEKEIMEPSANRLVQLSQQFMYAAKTDEDVSGFVQQLRQITMTDLRSTIKTDEEKKAFWINLYNAYTQVSLKKNPEQYKKRSQFFGSKQIEIAGKKFSLDDIEHGILRRSSIKWSLGHLKKPFPGKTEKQLRVNQLDYRLHFALNCGAKSCPPIAFYKAESINEQLALATKVYLTSEVKYDEVANRAELPTLMSWFRRDFGGKKGMLSLLRELSIVPADKKPAIQFKEYDWTLYLQNYKS